ncbi:MAG TPA: hypothetical protein VK674_06220 [Candidatus Limnocylindria bacterium]|nr:hypothetical protein [Candidatus Limnocylindria bacterium]
MSFHELGNSHGNPNLIEPATVFDVAPGTTLEILDLENGLRVQRTVQILSDVVVRSIADGIIQMPQVRTITTRHSPDGDITRKVTQSLSDLGVVPYPGVQPPLWHHKWASQVQQT